MRLPDFIIGGAPRAGTTWLVHALDRHPGVRMAQPLKPEPKFFLVDEVYGKGLGHYSRTWFAGIPEGVAAGEKSTNYLESAVACARMARDVPRVKLVFILRDPIERAWSNWRWSRMNGLEDLDFEQAIAEEARRESSLESRFAYSRPYSYISRGLYADLLEPWLAAFSRDQLLVLAFEDILRDAPGFAARVHGFLGVAPRPADALDLGRINPSEGGDERAPPPIRRQLADRFADSNLRLERMLGQAFRGWSGARP
jgi:hypothetical protein